jgi:hypothetical protein
LASSPSGLWSFSYCLQHTHRNAHRPCLHCPGRCRSVPLRRIRLKRVRCWPNRKDRPPARGVPIMHAWRRLQQLQKLVDCESGPFDYRMKRSAL